MKKKYVAPEMLVIKYEHEGCLLNGSDEPEDYGNQLGLNDGVSDDEFV
ncbi:hypothetical protein [Fibrobacter sp. UWB11]|nr:hypothetical protein [Fibrobacter sp. UWB11]